MSNPGILATLRYIVAWSIASPWDAYRAGEQYHWLVGLLGAVVPGLPGIVIRLVIGPLMAGFNYFTSGDGYAPWQDMVDRV